MIFPYFPIESAVSSRNARMLLPCGDINNKPLAAMCGCVLFFIGHFVKTKCIIMFAFDNRHTKLRGFLAIFGQFLCNFTSSNTSKLPTAALVWVSRQRSQWCMVPPVPHGWRSWLEITRLPRVSGDY